MSGEDIAGRFRELDRETTRAIASVYATRAEKVGELQALCAKSGHSLTRPDPIVEGARQCQWCRIVVAPTAYLETVPMQIDEALRA